MSLFESVLIVFALILNVILASNFNSRINRIEEHLRDGSADSSVSSSSGGSLTDGASFPRVSNRTAAPYVTGAD